MSVLPDTKDLTDEQSATLEKAALLIINARREAGEMLRRAEIQRFDDDFFGSRCRKCGNCREFVGNDDVCRRSACRHNASQHAT
ncbi:DUF6422 family protein [Streptomyces sp. NPDC058739]|uniref:DUF6422 family protein n=1 Tax=Streptomyces sp. NPDC058739 TaxID=3346618 RepID=UPI0036AB1C62